MTDERKIELYSCDDGLEYMYETIDEAIEYHFTENGGVDIFEGNESIELDKFPEFIEVYGCAKLPKPTPNQIKPVLERIIENLDEDYCSGTDLIYDTINSITSKMIEAEEKFINTIIEEYEVKVYESIKTIKINLHEWIKENTPDWIIDNLIIK